MVIPLILEGGWWFASKTYDLGHYMIYGKQETIEEKVLRELGELKEQGIYLQKSNEELRRQGVDVTVDKDIEKRLDQRIEELRKYTEDMKKERELERLELMKNQDVLLKKLDQLEAENINLRESIKREQINLVDQLQRMPSERGIYECYKELAKKR